MASILCSVCRACPADALRCRAARYVALRNIDIIVQRYPDLLANEVKVCTYPLCDILQALPLFTGEGLHRPL
jgi:hypothetical protein